MQVSCTTLSTSCGTQLAPLEEELHWFSCLYQRFSCLPFWSYVSHHLAVWIQATVPNQGDRPQSGRSKHRAWNTGIALSRSCTAQ